MANKVKFCYPTGYSLSFTVFDEDGYFRTTEYLSLDETRDTGYYTGNSTFPLTTGDVIVVYENEVLYYEDESLVDTTYEELAWEGEILYYEGSPLASFDDTYVTPLIWNGEPVGFGEYIDQNDLLVLINQIITDQTDVVSDLDSSYLDAYELLRRALESDELMYFELRK